MNRRELISAFLSENAYRINIQQFVVCFGLKYKGNMIKCAVSDGFLG